MANHSGSVKSRAGKAVQEISLQEDYHMVIQQMIVSWIIHVADPKEIEVPQLLWGC